MKNSSNENNPDIVAKLYSTRGIRNIRRIIGSVIIVLALLVFGLLCWIPFITIKGLSELEDSQRLLYWGSCISAFGTVFLGVVALWQSHIITVQNITANAPRIRAMVLDSPDNYKTLINVHFENYSNNVAHNFCISKIRIITVLKRKITPDVNVYHKLLLPENAKFTTTLKFPEIIIDKIDRLEFYINYTDKLGNYYSKKGGFYFSTDDCYAYKNNYK